VKETFGAEDNLDLKEAQKLLKDNQQELDELKRVRQEEEQKHLQLIEDLKMKKDLKEINLQFR
jgi:hypothetical protein